MEFVRMGRVNLSDIQLRPTKNRGFDGTLLPFEIVDLNILKRAHFCDEVQAAYLYACPTYNILVECSMVSGYTTRMCATCTADEYQVLNQLFAGGQT